MIWFILVPIFLIIIFAIIVFFAIPSEDPAIFSTLAKWEREIDRQNKD